MHLVYHPHARTHELDLVAVSRPAQTIRLDPWTLKSLLQLCLQTLAQGRIQRLPFLEGFFMKEKAIAHPATRERRGHQPVRRQSRSAVRLRSPLATLPATPRLFCASEPGQMPQRPSPRGRALRRSRSMIVLMLAWRYLWWSKFNISFWSFQPGCPSRRMSAVDAPITGTTPPVPPAKAKGRLGATLYPRLPFRKSGAGDEIRTHDPNLGKVMLYP